MRILMVSSCMQDRLRPGNVVQLTSKLGGKCLRVTETGAVDCYGEGGLQASPCE